jgi:polysaccharide export outer membrane protein
MKMKSLIHRIALLPVGLSMLAAVVLVIFSGCGTTGSSPKDAAMSTPGTNDVVLREADVIKVIFPDSKMDASQEIRRDGKVTLPIIGDITAAGKTPEQLKKELVERYSKEIVSSKDIAVALVSSSFPVYVSGAVQRPGKVTGDHTLNVVEAIMEAGGFDLDKAQLKSVKVVRTQNGKTHTYIINLKGLQTPGATVETFYLQPGDIVIVPQKVTIF